MPLGFYFKDWLFSKLPEYFKANDTYVDLNNEGLLERYLRNFGMELDENIVPFIDNFLDLFDAVRCQASLLPHLSFILGLPITIDNTESTYRKVLQYAIQLYKIKGTGSSFEMLFNLLALEIRILEDEPQGPVTYDANPAFIYDDPQGIRQYDTGCAACSGYSIAYNLAYNSLNTGIIDPSVLVIAQKIICFLQPINATFNGFIKRLNITEPFHMGITESSTVDAFLEEPGEFSEDFNIDTEFD